MNDMEKLVKELKQLVKQTGLPNDNAYDEGVVDCITEIRHFTPTPSKVTDKPTAPVELVELVEQLTKIQNYAASCMERRDEPEFTIFCEIAGGLSGVLHELETPTAPVPSKSESGLREAIKEYLNNDCPPIAWYSLDEKKREYFKGVECVQRILARILESNPSIPTPPDEIEPLAVLAGKDGFNVKIFPPTCILDSWDIELARHKAGVLDSHEFKARTYALAEAKARAYLSPLPDVKEGK